MQSTQAPLIIATNINPTMLNSQQLLQTAHGQLILNQAQFVPGPNNTLMITNTAPQPQQQLILQQDLNEPHYYEGIPVYVQSNGQQTILNLPHIQQSQQQQATSSSETDEIEIQEVVQNYDEEDEYTCEDDGIKGFL